MILFALVFLSLDIEKETKIVYKGSGKRAVLYCEEFIILVAILDRMGERQEQPAAYTLRHIYLAGLRGSGKSSVGEALAARLNLKRVDGDASTNQILAARGYESVGHLTGKDSPLPKNWQWPNMRIAESLGIMDFCREYEFVDGLFTPGGGALADGVMPELTALNTRMLQSWGTGFYLVPDEDDKQFSIGVLAERVVRDNAQAMNSGKKDNYRNLMFGLRLEDFATPLDAYKKEADMAWDKRHDLYKKATAHTINTRGLSIDEVAERIVSRYCDPLRSLP